MTAALEITGKGKIREISVIRDTPEKALYH